MALRVQRQVFNNHRGFYNVFRKRVVELENKRRNWFEDLELKGKRFDRDNWRRILNNYERDIEQNFLLELQTIVPINNQDERNLYLFKLGKRLEKNRNDELNAAVNRLKQLQQDKKRIQSTWHKWGWLQNTHNINVETNREKNAREQLSKIQSALSKIKVANPNAPGYDELSRFYDQ